MKTTNLTTYNLLGMFPKGVVLNKKAGYKKSTISIRLEPLTDEQEDYINNNKNIWSEGKFIRDDGVEFAANNILLYGEVELNNREFIDFINKLDIIPEDNSWYRTKVDLKTGKVSKQEVRLQSQTFNNFTWFEYNYMLIGRPNKIIIYECPDIHRRVPQFNK